MAIYKVIYQKSEQDEQKTIYVSFFEKNENEMMNNIVKGLIIELEKLTQAPIIQAIRKVKNPKGDVLYIYLNSISTSGKSSIELYQRKNQWKKENILYFLEEFIIEIGSFKQSVSSYHLFEQFS